MKDMIKGKNIEIMSPAGSYESLMAAVKAGAGSVYFGAGSMNMRSKSSYNFTEEDLGKITEICRKHGVKSYLTVNTIIYDHELDEVDRVLDAAKSNDITAVIASDIAVIQKAKEKGIDVHISTQCNITNIEAVKFYSRFADVMVLARELSLEQVKKITEEIEEQNITGPSGEFVRIEMFIHGALCMAVSGKCYLSLHEMNRSANRGGCLQTCRKAYTVTEKSSGNQLEIDNEYIMSPKDLKTIHFLNKILDAGVTVLKIEGRGRSPEYVQTVTQCYREAVEAIIDRSYGEDKIMQWNERLATVFNRGFWDGYYLGQRLGEWSHRYGSRATKRKIYIGKVTNYYSNIGIAEVLVQSHDIEKNEEYLLIGPTTGVIRSSLNEMRIDKAPEQIKAEKGDFITFPVDEKVRKNDKLYKVIPASKAHQQ